MTHFMKDGKSLILAILFSFWHGLVWTATWSHMPLQWNFHKPLLPRSYLWQNHLKISLQWYRCSGRMVPIPNIHYTRCQRALWWVCYKVPWVSVIFLLLDLSSIIYTLLVFDFVINDYRSITTIFLTICCFYQEIT